MCHAHVLHVVQVPCTCNAFAMHMLCMCHAHAMHVACTCYACAMHTLCKCHAHAIYVVHEPCPCFARAMHRACMCHAHVMPGKARQARTAQWREARHNGMMLSAVPGEATRTHGRASARKPQQLPKRRLMRTRRRWHRARRRARRGRCRAASQLESRHNHLAARPYISAYSKSDESIS